MSRMTPEELQMLLDLLPYADSLRHLAEVSGIERNRVRVALGPYVALMRANGTAGQCRCGRNRFHRGFCAIDGTKYEQREERVALLLTGEPIRMIALRTGLNPLTLKGYVKVMTPAQREARTKAIAAWNRREPVVMAQRNTLYSRIRSAMPAWLDDHLRDDAISELMLAVYEGDISEADVMRHAERFARAARNEYASKFGPVSLDRKRFEEGDETIGDTIPDPAALSAFDYIFEERI